MLDALLVGAEEERALRGNDFRGQSLAEVDGLAVDPVPGHDFVREPDDVGRVVVNRDIHVARTEDRSDPLPDNLADRVEVDLPGKGHADLVDDGELVVSLASLLDGPDSAQRGSDVLTDECEEVAVGVRVALVRGVGLAHEDTLTVSVGGERTPIQSPSSVTTPSSSISWRSIRSRCAGPRSATPVEAQYVCRRPASVPVAERLPDVRVGDVRVEFVDVVRVVDRPRSAS